MSITDHVINEFLAGLKSESLANRMQEHRTNHEGIAPKRGKALAWARAAIESLRDIQRERELERQYADKLP